eukprot:TRINITY_DN366_c0_g1_i1.p1 TRINITY_DN366_c0_g1~~TRINITY_DN366_c0_g1_i1.p1  ORF type:complete len:702 (+),score=188.57 TRINITY_DN366_c0_g1_i1:49-2154(+)
MASTDRELRQRCVNTIRVLSAEQPSAAKAGHPGAPIGLAPVAYLLWSQFMKYNPANSQWLNRDRFVLSNGHACALLYSMLHLTGYDLSLNDLKNFRQVHSKTPGHPEVHVTEGVEVTTGPLGQGLSNGVGLAIAAKHLAATFNKPNFELFNSNVWVLCGDGCLQEGITSEASSLAGHLRLGNLKIIYDDNLITIDGETSLSFSEDVVKRYESYGFHTITVDKADEDLDALSKALQQAAEIYDKPVLVKVRTTIGFGSLNQGTEKVHGSPLKDDDLAQLKTKFGFDPKKSFDVPEDVSKFFSALKQRGAQLESNWNTLFEAYSNSFPDLHSELKRRLNRTLPADLFNHIPKFPSDKPMATRQHSGQIINALAPHIPELIGGSADLNPSTLTYLSCSKDYQGDTPEGRNIRYGVREHAMAAISNGIAGFGTFIPFNSTFLNFIGYAWGSVILSCLSHFQVIYIMTHDSIGLGEDGPTHQPVEKLMMCRMMPNLYLFRPADGQETAAAYIAALKRTKGPSVLALSRSSVKYLNNSSIEKAGKGAYVVHTVKNNTKAADKVDLIIIATGTEVGIAIDAADKLGKEESRNIEVVSMPCWELFEEQSEEYRREILRGGQGVPIMSVEAGVKNGWEKYAHGSVGLDRFGLSGPADKIYKELGLDADGVVARAKRLIHFYEKNGPVPDLTKRPFGTSDTSGVSGGSSGK